MWKSGCLLCRRGTSPHPPLQQQPSAPPSPAGVGVVIEGHVEITVSSNNKYGAWGGVGRGDGEGWGGGGGEGEDEEQDWKPRKVTEQGEQQAEEEPQWEEEVEEQKQKPGKEQEPRGWEEVKQEEQEQEPREPWGIPAPRSRWDHLYFFLSCFMG